MKVQFTDSTKRLEGERRSKLLSPSSDFYKYLDQIDQKLKKLYPGSIGPKRMDYHIELIFRNDLISEDLLIKRAKELEGLEIQNLDVVRMGSALVIETPQVDSFRTHATISFFPNGFPESVDIMIRKLSSL